MKKIIKKGFAICIMMSMILSFAIVSYAQTDKEMAGMMVREYQDGDAVGVEVSPRGELISSIELEMTEEGYRTVGIYSEILCHEEMKNIQMKISLQRLSGGSWTSVNTKTFKWNKADYPNTDLSMGIASYKVGSLKAGDYRLFATYSVTSPDGMHESKTVISPSKNIP